MNKPLVVVGTPGRLAELSRAGILQSHNTTILVLDEVPADDAPEAHQHVMSCDLAFPLQCTPFAVWAAMDRCGRCSLDLVLRVGHTPLQVDQLLAVQFREDMVRLVDHVGRKAPEKRQTILVSATLNEKVLASHSPTSDSP